MGELVACPSKTTFWLKHNSQIHLKNSVGNLSYISHEQRVINKLLRLRCSSIYDYAQFAEHKILVIIEDLKGSEKIVMK